MGKALKSSMKALQDAIVNIIPAAPICMQQGRTDSFRDLYSSFNSMYYTATASSVSSSSVTVPAQALFPAPASCPPLDDAPPLPPDDDGCSTVDIATRAQSNCYSSGASSSSSSLPAADCENSEAMPCAFNQTGSGGAASSSRFFFSPKTTKSIMEEAKLEAGLRKIRSLGNPPGPDLRVETEEEIEEEADGVDQKQRQRLHPRRRRRSSNRHRRKESFCEESTPLVMASHDPYIDFRASMEEMVEAHGLKDWSGLQELLSCYLRLNDKTTHSVIMLAFADLVMRIVSTSESFSSTRTTTSTAATTNTSSVISFSNPSPCSSSPVLNLSSD